MKAFSYLTTKGEPRIGVQTPEGLLDFTQLWGYFKELKNFPRAPELPFLQLMVELDYFSEETFAEVIAAVREYRSLDDIIIREPFSWQLPVQRPTKILCLGRNYRAHAAELNNTVPEAPMYFAKVPSSLLPHQGHIRIPAGVGRVDHELELALVIGKRGANIPESKAMEHVAGYTIANDITAREMQREEQKKGKPWTLAKGMDTFCPLGPWLVPAGSVADPHNLTLELKVDGEVRQKGSTADMVYGIPELIAYISRYMTLEPGDLLLTGTPEGVGPIQPGNRIEGSIDGLGTLENGVVQAGSD
ncbi:MAG: Ureidoglycolate lyase [bacterium ADurb.Bin431]|nr:MAG: Ureidoglycolate lyase [bacterium ADurb.Bin431]